MREEIANIMSEQFFKFNVCGQEIEIRAALAVYNFLRLSFAQIANDAAKEYGKKYDSYGNIENVLAPNKGYYYGFKLIMDVIESVVIECLMEAKIYDIDSKRFFNEFYKKKYFVWEKNFNEVKSVYLSIEHEQQRLDAHRTQRRENRGRWVGLGVEGAIKAGAMNMATGAAHGMFNIGAKALSEADAASQKNALYKNPTAKKILTDGIKKSLFNIHYAILDVLKINSEVFRDFHVECLEYQANEKDEAIRNNFLRMPKDEVRKIFPQVLLRNPYDVELYKTLFSIFGDQDGGLEEIALFFGVNVSFITESKDALVKELCAKVGDNFNKSKQSKQDALEKRKKFALALESNGLTKNQLAQDILAEIDSIINDLDKKERTILVYNKELTFENSEDAEKIKAMSEYQELQQSCELYMKLSDTVQSNEIKKMPELLKKMPENIKVLYFEQLSDFELARGKETQQQSIFKLIINIAICLGILFFCWSHWDGWNWWGLKGISSAIMFILPSFMFTYENELLNVIYWCVAFLSFMLPSWDKSLSPIASLFSWNTPIIIVAGLAVLSIKKWLAIFNEYRKKSKRAAVYMKDFEDLTSQYDEYRNFKNSVVKNKADN